VVARPYYQAVWDSARARQNALTAQYFAENTTGLVVKKDDTQPSVELYKQFLTHTNSLASEIIGHYNYRLDFQHSVVCPFI
jgi:hypothetical protein